ncbi:MAG: hypothetical protein KKC75_03775 [Nanoarchaeota archaeon]|nr:hypothetical protein [Nanoarchaeota archaeon]MBU1005648.1 hypothetical protein [Nanoarchaeota archaeon]MBU1945817.1 hypothetical protein [Nanoarchaeota archaeon]
MVWYKSTQAKDNRKFNKGRFLRKEINLDTLKDMYYNGKPIKEIASFFNCSIPTIKRHLKLIVPESLRRYKFNYSESNPINQRIIKLYTNHHYSTNKIAGIIGLTDETIRKRLLKLGIALRKRNFKNLETFHPMRLNRIKDKNYPIVDLNQFNQKFLEYYCLMHTQKNIAELLQIDRATVSRRIKYLRSQYYFKLRFCKRCNNLFRFRVTEHQRNANICSRCRLS